MCVSVSNRGEVDADRRVRADLDRADAAQLAVALHRVAVAEEQQAARHRDGQQQRAAGAHLLDVHVAAVRPVVDGADGVQERRGADRADHRPHGDLAPAVPVHDAVAHVDHARVHAEVAVPDPVD
jgi:hypothetical protein